MQSEHNCAFLSSELFQASLLHDVLLHVFGFAFLCLRLRVWGLDQCCKLALRVTPAETRLMVYRRLYIPAQGQSDAPHSRNIAPKFWRLRGFFSGSLCQIVMALWGTQDTYVILISAKRHVKRNALCGACRISSIELMFPKI